jgi:glycosyltransferase involved in cell wall biosynthesis
MFSPTVRLYEAEAHARFVDNYIDLSNVTAGELRLLFPVDGSLTKYFLVIDIYGSHGDHPNRHIGWWSFELAKLAGSNTNPSWSIPLRRLGERVVVDAAKVPSFRDCWENEDYQGNGNPQIHVVLRRNSNGAIVFDQSIEVLLTEASRIELETYRRSLTSDLMRPVTAAPLWFSWPADSEVRITLLDFTPLEPVSAFVLDCCQFLRAQGIKAHIYADRFDPRFRGTIRQLSNLAEEANERDIIIVNYACFDPYLKRLTALDCGKMLFFHGIVPPRTVHVYDAELARYLTSSVKQASLFQHFDAVLAGWKTTARELFRSFCFADYERPDWDLRQSLTYCAPVLGLEAWKEIRPTESGFGEGSLQLLFVGILAPQAGIDRLLKLFEAFGTLRPDARLVIVAREVMPTYATYIDYLLSNRLNSRVTERIEIVTNPSWNLLKALYQSASAFVSCIYYDASGTDLIDAISFGLPVFSVMEPMAEEVLGRSAFYFTDDDAAAQARFMARILDEPAVLASAVTRQARRRRELKDRVDGSEFGAALLATSRTLKMRLQKLSRSRLMTRATTPGLGG